MSHIFGLEHSLGGIIGQAANVFGSIWAGSTPTGGGPALSFADIPGGSPGFGETGGLIGPALPTNGVVTTMANGTCAPKKRTTETCVVIDNFTGQVISTREVTHRKRRKRLATKSDIADLAALKSILGGGKALDAWIATRGGR